MVDCVSQVRLEQPEDLAIKHRKESTDAICFAAAEVTTPEEFWWRHLVIALSSGAALSSAKLAHNGRTNISASLCNRLNSTNSTPLSNNKRNDTTTTTDLTIENNNFRYYYVIKYFFLSFFLTFSVSALYIITNFKYVNRKQINFFYNWIWKIAYFVLILLCPNISSESRVYRGQLLFSPAELNHLMTCFWPRECVVAFMLNH